MELIDKILRPSKLAADSLKDVTFFKYAFPILTVVGSGVLFYYGYRGIFKKHTINLTKFEGMSFSQSVNIVGPITGITAVIVGSFYILLGIFLFTILGVMSYYIWF